MDNIDTIMLLRANVLPPYTSDDDENERDKDAGKQNLSSNERKLSHKATKAQRKGFHDSKTLVALCLCVRQEFKRFYLSVFASLRETGFDSDSQGPGTGGKSRP